MTPEHRPETPTLPDWALRERKRDMEWIRENLDLFWSAAVDGFKEDGRGAIVVDAESRPTGRGNPFGYVPGEVLDSAKDEEIKRMVREYDPQRELVLVLLKPEDRTSTYRVVVKRRGE